MQVRFAAECQDTEEYFRVTILWKMFRWRPILGVSFVPLRSLLTKNQDQEHVQGEDDSLRAHSFAALQILFDRFCLFEIVSGPSDAFSVVKNCFCATISGSDKKMKGLILSWLVPLQMSIYEARTTKCGKIQFLVGQTFYLVPKFCTQHLCNVDHMLAKFLIKFRSSLCQWSLPPKPVGRNVRRSTFWVCHNVLNSLPTKQSDSKSRRHNHTSLKVCSTSINASLIAPGQIKYGMAVFSDQNAPDLLVNSSLQGGQIRKSFSTKASLDPVKHPKIARGQIQAVSRVWEQFNVMLHDESAGWA